MAVDSSASCRCWDGHSIHSVRLSFLLPVFIGVCLRCLLRPPSPRSRTGLLFAGAFVYMALVTQHVPDNMLALLGGLGGFLAQVLVLFSLQYFERAVGV